MQRRWDFSWLKDWRVGAFAGVLAGFLVGMLIFGSPWHLPPAWGDIPTWLLVILAAVGGGVALSQLRIQQRQIKEQQDALDRDATERRRAQTARVFTGVPDSNVGVGLVAPYAENASDFPVFDAQFWYARPSGLSDPDNLSVIMPHKQATTTPRFSAARAREQTILTFRDAEGVHWVRMPDGTLSEQTRDTARASVQAILPETPLTPPPVTSPPPMPELERNP